MSNQKKSVFLQTLIEIVAALLWAYLGIFLFARFIVTPATVTILLSRRDYDIYTPDVNKAISVVCNFLSNALIYGVCELFTGLKWLSRFSSVRRIIRSSCLKLTYSLVICFLLPSANKTSRSNSTHSFRISIDNAK
jgi:hypothetical protein